MLSPGAGPRGPDACFLLRTVGAPNPAASRARLAPTDWGAPAARAGPEPGRPNPDAKTGARGGRGEGGGRAQSAVVWGCTPATTPPRAGTPPYLPSAEKRVEPGLAESRKPDTRTAPRGRARAPPRRAGAPGARKGPPGGAPRKRRGSAPPAGLQGAARPGGASARNRAGSAGRKGSTRWGSIREVPAHPAGWGRGAVLPSPQDDVSGSPKPRACGRGQERKERGRGTISRPDPTRTSQKPPLWT